MVNNCNADVSATPVPSTVRCYSLNTSVSGTVSDNETYMIVGMYSFAAVPLKLYAGYEHIAFDNPTDPLSVGTVIIGGYTLAAVNNTAYDNQKTLEVFWGGLKWNLTPDLELTAAYYGYKQNSFATGAHAGCSTDVNAGCSGTENAVSALIDYRLSKRFDVYLGSMWSGVQDGLASGYLPYSRNNVATTAGLRFKF